MNLENYSESQLPSLVHKAILIGQCIREIDAHWPEINSTTQRTIVTYSFIIVSEMISCADYSIFQEVIFGSYSCLQMPDFGRKKIVEVKCYLQTILHAEWKVDTTSQSQSCRQFLTIQLFAQVGGLETDRPEDPYSDNRWHQSQERHCSCYLLPLLLFLADI